MGKQVRAFNLDNEVGAAIDAEANLLGPDKKSALVNELLREALARRRNTRVAFQVAKGTAIATVSAVFLWVLLVLV